MRTSKFFKIISEGSLTFNNLTYSNIEIYPRPTSSYILRSSWYNPFRQLPDEISFARRKVVDDYRKRESSQSPQLTCTELVATCYKLHGSACGASLF